MRFSENADSSQMSRIKNNHCLSILYFLQKILLAIRFDFELRYEQFPCATCRIVPAIFYRCYPAPSIIHNYIMNSRNHFFFQRRTLLSAALGAAAFSAIGTPLTVFAAAESDPRCSQALTPADSTSSSIKLKPVQHGEPNTTFLSPIRTTIPQFWYAATTMTSRDSMIFGANAPQNLRQPIPAALRKHTAPLLWGSKTSLRPSNLS